MGHAHLCQDTREIDFKAWCYITLGATLAGGTLLCTEGDLIWSGVVWCGMKHLKLNSIYKVLYININGKPIWQKEV